MSKLLHQADFDPHLKKVFQVHSEAAGIVKINLVEVTGKSTKEIESFSLIFKGPKEPVLPQMTYKMKHSKLGEFMLFLVPIAYGKQDGTYYQSIFNRLIAKK